MNALDKANNDTRIHALHKDISQVKINYVRSKDDSWGSNLVGKKATIWWAECRHPSASLAHELLHIKLQLNGYKRIRVSVSNLDEPKVTMRLMSCIDNEIQHHKIYPEFISLKFKPDQFYCDTDTETEVFLTREISKGFSSTAEAAIAFLSLVAPGGCLSDKAKIELRKRIDAVDDGLHMKAFGEIEGTLSEWIEAPTSDATEFIRSILLSIKPSNNLTWYGFNSTDRPAAGVGVFSDQPFEMEY